MHGQLEHLAAQAKNGDMDAASEIVSISYQSIYAFLRRLSGNDTDAADLTQLTYSRAWTALPNFRAESRLLTWLHGIARHVYLDWRRRRRADSHPPDEWWNRCPDAAPSPFEDAVEQDLARRLYGLVDQLDEEKRDTIHLHYYQGLSLQDTAEVLGIAASTVKYRLREALDWLRRHAEEPQSLKHHE